MGYKEYKVAKVSQRQDGELYLPDNAIIGSIREFTIGENPGYPAWEIIYMTPVEE